MTEEDILPVKIHCYFCLSTDWTEKMRFVWRILAIGCIVLCDSASSASPACRPTKEDIEGPYYIPGAPLRNSSTLCNVTEYSNSTTLIIKGRVLDEDCETGVKSLLDVWSANEEGEYSLLPGDYDCRGKFLTDAKGYFRLHSVVPGRYLEFGGFRPAHIHWKVSRLTDPKRVLTTQLYFQHDPYLDSNDPCAPFCHSGNPTITVPLVYDHKRGNNTAVVKWHVVLQKKRKHEHD